MIVEVTVVVHTCPQCGSENIVRNGHDYKGAQKHHCHDCGAYGTLEKKANHDERTRQQATDAYFERMSMRGVKRVFSVARNTLAHWLEEEAASLPELSTTLAGARADDVLELDELWSFVSKKSNKRWIWLALCRRTRQIVAYVIGDRSEATCRKLWNRIPEAYRHCRTFSDFWEAYQLVCPAETHSAVGKESGETNHIERWNNTLRQRLGRFVRKTLSFSKSERFHEIALKIFLHRYNLSRLKSISQT